LLEQRQQVAIGECEKSGVRHLLHISRHLETPPAAA
jgi:hypothetical protein